jgi:NAD(P)-dependent dehydrogenase (short-subunit alcohol dehydrogenase family)
LTGASGTLGLKLCEELQKTHAIAAVHFRHGLSVATQNQHFFDPLNPNETIVQEVCEVHAIEADLSNDLDLQRIIEITLARFRRIDLLINAAGCFVARSLIYDEQSMESAERQFRINVFAPLKLMKIAFDRFWRNRRRENALRNRNIINISSLAGVDIFVDRGQAIYGASKAALNFLTCSLAKEVQGIGLRLNAVAPDSFSCPATLSRVVDVIKRIDSSSMDGKVVTVDANGEDEVRYVQR